MTNFGYNQLSLKHGRCAALLAIGVIKEADKQLQQSTESGIDTDINADANVAHI